ncbi:hypothetical protein D3C81_1362290 [compost metagenome]
MASLTRALRRTRTGLSDHITDLRAALALADLRLILIVVAELRFIQAADGHLDYLIALGHNNRFFTDQIGKILPDCFFYLALMTFLVELSLAVQRPVVARDHEQAIVHVRHLPRGFYRFNKLPTYFISSLAQVAQ